MSTSGTVEIPCAAPAGWGWNSARKLPSPSNLPNGEMPGGCFRSPVCGLRFLARGLAAGLTIALISFGAPADAMSAENNVAGPPARTENGSTTQDVLRAYLQLQEQLHTTQLAIERNRQEAEAAAARNAEAIAARLHQLEQALSAQRTRELDSMHGSTRLMLYVAGGLAGVGFLAMLLTAFFQWRAVNRLADTTAALPMAHALSGGPLPAALAAGDAQLAANGPGEPTGARLLSAIERLEERIRELEHTAGPHQPLNEAAGSGAGVNIGTDARAAEQADGQSAPPETHQKAEQIRVLLGKGQSLLSLDQVEQAVACFDAALAIDPVHAETLLKKGEALERLEKYNEAIACYDLAIEADRAMTIAYLHKGGVFNRLERYSEALECYEQALRTQEKAQTPS